MVACKSTISWALGISLAISLDLPVTIIPVDARPPSPAEVLKHNFKVPCADAFASSLTYEPGCRTSQDQTTLVTTDLDFKEETHF
jgi:hypothetical protein